MDFYGCHNHGFIKASVVGVGVRPNGFHNLWLHIEEKAPRC